MDNFNNQQPVAPQPVAPQPANNGKAFSIVALVLGIVSAVMCWWGWFSIIALIMAVVAIVLGIMGRNAAKASGQSMGMATAGMILGIVGAALSGIALVCWICVACSANAITNELSNVDWSSLQ